MFQYLQNLLFGGTLEKRDRSSNSSSSSSYSRSAKKHKADLKDLHKLLSPNTYYKVLSTAHLRYIIDRNPNIVCSVLEMNDDNVVETIEYENLSLTPIIYTREQHTIYDKYNKGTTLSTFQLYGSYANDRISISDDEEEEDEGESIRKLIINDFHLDYIYVKTDSTSMYDKLIIYKYSAPTYDEVREGIYTENEEKFIKNEQTVFNSKITELNVASFPHKYQEIAEDIEDEIEYLGGSVKKSTSYRKFLNKQSMTKLQNIAKNKKISYQKKQQGKTVDIKRTTLMDKLCEKYMTSMNLP